MATRRQRESIEKRFSRCLRSLGVPRGASFLIAFSGGADSTALLELLAGEVKKRGERLVATYVNHGLRSWTSLEKEESAVREAVNRRGIPLVTLKIPPGELEACARREGRSLEDVARARRYLFFRDVQTRRSLDYLAVAHTRDDQIETLVMRFFQGSGAAGLSGIPPSSGGIIRPLLSWEHQELVAYLTERDVPYFEDPTNKDLSFLRNKIRQGFLPHVREIFPGYRRSLVQGAEKMRSCQEMIEENVLLWEKVPAQGYRTPWESFRRASFAVKMESLFQVYDRLASGQQGRAKRLPYAFLRILRDRGASPFPLRGHGIEVRRQGEHLYCCRKKDKKPGEFCRVVRSGDSIPLPRGVIHFVEQWPNNEGSVLAIRQEDTDSLVLRSKREGDAIGMGEKRKTLLKIFAEWGVVEESLRISPPLLVTRKGVVAIFGEVCGRETLYTPPVRRFFSPPSAGEWVYFYREER